jgi:hypothetical protein
MQTQTQTRIRTCIRTHSHTRTHTAPRDPGLDAMPSEPERALPAQLPPPARPASAHCARRCAAVPDAAAAREAPGRRPALSGSVSAGSLTTPSSLSGQSPPPSCSHRLSRAHVQRSPHLPRAVSLLLGKALPAPASAAESALTGQSQLLILRPLGRYPNEICCYHRGHGDSSEFAVCFRCSCLVLVYGLAISSWPESPGLGAG